MKTFWKFLKPKIRFSAWNAIIILKYYFLWAPLTTIVPDRPTSSEQMEPLENSFN